MQTFNHRECLACAKPLSGRIDKKFCDDQCRATYNNRNKKAHEELIHSTNKALRKNRMILKSLCPNGKATVRKEVLIEMGFDFNVFTSIFPAKGKLYYFSYEFGIMPILETSISEGVPVKKVLIIERQPFMSAYDPWKYVKN